MRTLLLWAAVMIAIAIAATYCGCANLPPETPHPSRIEHHPATKACPYSWTDERLL